MAHKQLTFEDRTLIELLLKDGSSQASIARAVDVHRSTIKKEIDRNSVNGIYKAKKAHRETLNRKRASRGGYFTYQKQKICISDKNVFSRQKAFPGLPLQLLKKSEHIYNPYSFSTIKAIDNRRGRTERFRHLLSLFQQDQRTWLLSQRVRNHFEERLDRTSRNTLDWTRYNRLASIGLPSCIQAQPLGKYFRTSRTFLGRHPNRYYRKLDFKLPGVNLNFLLKDRSFGKSLLSIYEYVPYAIRKKFSSLKDEQQKVNISQTGAGQTLKNNVKNLIEIVSKPNTNKMQYAPHKADVLPGKGPTYKYYEMNQNVWFISGCTVSDYRFLYDLETRNPFPYSLLSRTKKIFHLLFRDFLLLKLRSKLIRPNSLNLVAIPPLLVSSPTTFNVDEKIYKGGI